MFDEFLAAWAQGHGEPFVPFTQDDYERYVDGSPRLEGTRAFLRSRGIDLPEGDASDDAGHVDRARPRQPQERPGPGPPRPGAVRVFEGSVAFVRAVRAEGLRTAVVSSSANTLAVLRAAGLEDLFDARIDGVVAADRHLPGKPAPDTFVAGAHEPRRRARPGRRVRGRAGRGGGRPAGGVRPGGRRQPGRARPAEDLRRHGADVVVARSRRAAGDGRDRALRSCRSGRAHGRVAARASPRAWALTSPLDSACWRRPSRCSRSPTATSACAATSTRASRTACPAPTSTAVYELRPLPYAEAGYGYPESGQTVINVTNGKLLRLLVDDEPFDVRYGDLRHHERTLDFRAGTLTRHVEWVSPAGTAVRVHSERLVSLDPARRRRHPLRGRGARQPAAGGRAVGAGGERGAAHPGQGPARRGGAGVAARVRGARGRRGRRGAGAPGRLQRAAGGGGDAPPRLRCRRPGSSASPAPRTGPRHRRRPAPAGGAAASWSSSSRYGWSAHRSRPPCATRSWPRSPGPADRLGGPAGRAAGLPRRLLGRRRRRGRGRRRDPAGRPLRAVPRAAGGRPGGAPLDPGQGAHRARLRRPRLLGHRDLRAAGAGLHAARRGRATRCAGATARCPPPGCGPHSWGSTARRSPGARSPARSAPATGLRGPPRST